MLFVGKVGIQDLFMGEIAWSFFFFNGDFALALDYDNFSPVGFINTSESYCSLAFTQEIVQTLTQRLS